MKQTNNTNVIFIGSFSPVHDGHIHLIEEYLKKGNNIDIIISGSPREGISPESSYNFLTKIFKNPKLGKKKSNKDNPNVNIEISKDNSPMLTAINKVKNAKSGTFALASSTKQGDEARSLDFKKKFEKGKSSYNPNVDVIKLNVDAEPLYYHNRTDQYNDKPISSTIIRRDIRNNDFDNFFKSYENIMKNYKISGNDIKEYYNIIRNELLPIKESSLYDDMNEAIEFKRPENIVKDNSYYNELYKVANQFKDKLISGGPNNFDINSIIDVFNKYNFDDIYQINYKYNLDNNDNLYISSDEISKIENIAEHYLNEINLYNDNKFERYGNPEIDTKGNIICLGFYIPNDIDNYSKQFYMFFDRTTLKPIINYDLDILFDNIIHESLNNFKKPTNIVNDNSYYNELYKIAELSKNKLLLTDSAIDKLVLKMVSKYNFHFLKNYNKDIKNLCNHYFKILEEKTSRKWKSVEPYIDEHNNIILLINYFKEYVNNSKYEKHIWNYIFIDAKTLEPLINYNNFDKFKMIYESSNNFKRPENIVNDNSYYNKLSKYIELSKNKIILNNSAFDKQMVNIINEYLFYDIEDSDGNKLFDLKGIDQKFLNDININSRIKFESYPFEYIDEKNKIILLVFVSKDKKYYMYIFIDANTLKPLVDYDFSKLSYLYKDTINENTLTNFKRPTNIVKDNNYYNNLYKVAELTKNTFVKDNGYLEDKVLDIFNEYNFYDLKNILSNDEIYVLGKFYEDKFIDKSGDNHLKFEESYIDKANNVILLIYHCYYFNYQTYSFIFIHRDTLKPLVNYDFKNYHLEDDKQMNENTLTNFKRPTNIVKDNSYYSKLYNLIDKTKNAFISFDDSNFNSLNDIIADTLNYYDFKSIKYLRFEKNLINREFYKKLINLYNEYYDNIVNNTDFKLKDIDDIGAFILIDGKSNIILFEYSFVTKRYSIKFKNELPNHTWLHIFLDTKTLKPIDGFNVKVLYLMNNPKESLNEDDGFDFKKQSNIIDDTIGINNLISNWIKEHTNIKPNEYTINDDHTIDVTLINDPNNQKLNKRDTVYIFENEHDFVNKITELPEYIKFNIINNNLNVSNSELKTLKGFPVTVIGNFDCSHCHLETLEHGPKYVTGKYICSNNILKNIDGAPIKCEEFIGIPQYRKVSELPFNEDLFTHEYWFKNYYNKTNESLNNFKKPDNIIKDNIDFIKITDDFNKNIKNKVFLLKGLTNNSDIYEFINKNFIDVISISKNEIKDNKLLSKDMLAYIDNIGYYPFLVRVYNSKVYGSDLQLFLYCTEQKNKFNNNAYIIFDLVNNTIDKSLNEGGAAKHMSHPYEINEFTFKDIDRLINDLLNGNINNATEKMDGLNLFVSFDKNGNIIAARNNKHLNGEPLTLENIKDNFKSQNIGNVYYNALKNIFDEVKTKYNNQSLKHLFKNGNRWLNTEIITADTENVIPYENSTIVFHDFRTYDNGELIKTDKDKLEEFVKSLSNNGEFKIITSPHIKINKSIDKEFKDEIINDINKIKSKYNLSDNSTIEDYKKNVLLEIILNDKTLSELSDNVITDLIDRWLNGPNKNYNINDILRGLDDSIKSYVKQIDKNINGLINDKMKPFDIIFIKVGNEVINNLSNISNNQNKDIVIQKLNKRLSEVAEQIANSDDENIKTKLYKELERLSNVSNKLNATEGIVFNWKDKLLKITGSFAPLNKILGLAPGRFDN